MRAVSCIACGSSEFEELLSPSDVACEQEWLREFYEARIGGAGSLKDHVEFTQSEPVHVVRCLACDTVLRNPQPTPLALRRKYRFDSYGSRTLAHLLESERPFFREKATGLAHRIEEGARILEIGSFVGAFLLAAKEQGWDATGVDVGRETCEFMRSHGLRVLEGDVLDLDLRGPYRAIFVWNTFDQINTPRPLLARCRELLDPDGLLVLRVPNGRFEVEALRLRGERWNPSRMLAAQAYNNFLSFPYLVGYTPESLQRLLGASGFDLVERTGDVILPLATRETRTWAVEEERRYKRVVLRVCGQCEREQGRFVYPWMDAIAIPRA